MNTTEAKLNEDALAWTRAELEAGTYFLRNHDKDLYRVGKGLYFTRNHFMILHAPDLEGPNKWMAGPLNDEKHLHYRIACFQQRHRTKKDAHEYVKDLRYNRDLKTYVVKETH